MLAFPDLAGVDSEALQSISALVSGEPGGRAVQRPEPHTLRFLKSAPASAPPTPLSGVGEALSDQALTRVTEAAWPKADVVIGNPPFLGGSKKRRELGDAYFAALDTVFAGRVPGGADLVCYWFDKARVQIQSGQLQSAGLVATQALRAGANRTVLERLLQTPTSEHNCDHDNRNLQHASTGKTRDRQASGQLGDEHLPRQQTGNFAASPAHRSGGIEVDDRPDARGRDLAGAQDLLLGKSLTIFNAWADEPWVNNGAAVRVSLVCFGVGAPSAERNGQAVACIHADLTSGDGLDLTLARPLPENTNASFEGTKKYGNFDISGQLARQWLALPNPHGQSNARVIKPWRNGQDLSQRPSDTWIVDFGASLSEADASLFETPFTHVLQQVKPARLKAKLPNHWWLHERARVAMRQALQDLPRYIATTRVSKHRHFSFLHASVLPDTRLNVIARADDTTFGILSARIHEVWSLAQASMHGVGNDPTYNAKSCFETFPFPAGLTPADTAHQQTETVAGGALIAAAFLEPNQPPALTQQAQAATETIAPSGQPPTQAGAGCRPGAISKSAAYEPPACAPSLPTSSLRNQAIAIAQAAKRLNDLRNNWLNPPEWTHKVPEVTPLGMDQSPYPDRIEAKHGISEADMKALQKRTLTNLYNLAPAWLTLAHQQLDAAVASAYGWNDYCVTTSDDNILKRLLALNLERSTTAA